MPPKFGTSGLRGLVIELTQDLVADHVRAFISACPVGTGLFVARDLRPSSPGIAQMVIDAARAEGPTSR
jgi:phosphomannomutase